MKRPSGGADAPPEGLAHQRSFAAGRGPQYRPTQPVMRKVGTDQARRKKAIWAGEIEPQAPTKVR